MSAREPWFLTLDPIEELLLAAIIVGGPPYPRGVRTYPEARALAHRKAAFIRSIIGKPAETTNIQSDPHD